MGKHEILEGRDHAAQILHSKIDILIDAAIFLDAVKGCLEYAMLDFEHDTGIHLDEAAITVEREPLIPGGLAQAGDGSIIDAKVEDRVHHPRHGYPRARTHRDQQGIARIAERLARRPFDQPQSSRNLIADAIK